MSVHKMNTLLVCDIVVILNDNTRRRIGCIVNFDPKIKPKASGSTLLNFNITEYLDKYKDNISKLYDDVLGSGFTMWLNAKINMILHNSQYKDTFTGLSLLNVKEIDKFNESIIADFPLKAEEENKELKGE